MLDAVGTAPGTEELEGEAETTEVEGEDETGEADADGRTTGVEDGEGEVDAAGEGNGRNVVVLSQSAPATRSPGSHTPVAQVNGSSRPRLRPMGRPRTERQIFKLSGP